MKLVEVDLSNDQIFLVIGTFNQQFTIWIIKRTSTPKMQPVFITKRLARATNTVNRLA